MFNTHQNSLFQPKIRHGVALIYLAIILAACSPTLQGTPTLINFPPQASVTAPPSQPSLPDATIQLPATASGLGTLSIFTPTYIPHQLLQAIALPGNIRFVANADEADLTLALSETSVLIHWVYALVAPFPTLTKDIPFSELQAIWNNRETQTIPRRHLIMDQSTYDLYAAWWGIPNPQAVKVLPTDNLLDYAWNNQSAWAIIPFEAIEPQWKVIGVDGQSPLNKDFHLDAYPLAVPFNIVDINGLPLDTLPESLNLPSSNRDPSKLTVLAMTGVTALVRGTALLMEYNGITYPAQDVGPLLRLADLTHISNEIPFVEECPFPFLPTPVPIGKPIPLISFCSRPSYIGLLEDVGADLIELTGDHFADWGDEAMRYTLDLYSQYDLPVYGGGMNDEQARQPLIVEHNGNKLAFIGCNIGLPTRSDQIPAYVLASPDHPGAAKCDFAWLSTEIPRLRAEGYQVIFTFQHREYDTMKAEPLLVDDFGRIADYGATVVSGSQAHQPHAMAFDNNAFIHYGLGNLFFDQYHFCADYACDYAFIDHHIFYDNHYLGVKLTPLIFIDLARPRLMTETEESAYLEKIFTASGWAFAP